MRLVGCPRDADAGGISGDEVVITVQDPDETSDEGQLLIGIEDRTDMISGVFVIRVLKREGGAILFNHSVVPLMTEK